MKYLIMTEGTCEEAFINVLIEQNIFNIAVEDLLYEDIFHARQINMSLIEKINQLPIDEKITIIRIGDKLSDKLIIPDEIKERISECKKICIKPEFEILLLIYEKLDTTYLKKYKSKQKASEFLYDHDHSYEKSYDLIYDIFMKMTRSEIISIIKRYTLIRKKTHSKDEGVIEDLIIK